MTKLEKIGKIIKIYRINKGLTQYELGFMLGKTQQLIGGWEKGIKEPKALDLLRVIIILGINPLVFSAIMEARPWNNGLDHKAKMEAWKEYGREKKT